MSSPLYLFYEAVAVTATAATLPLLLELLITGVGNLLPRRMVGGVNPCDAIRLHVLVPAYNEALLIQRTVGSLRASNLLSAESSASIIVIAHNCTDATALLAEAAGAVVLRESGPAGKGYAVEFGFAHAKTHGATHVTVIDADSTVSENLIGETIAAFKRGADATQVRYELDDMNDPKRPVYEMDGYGQEAMDITVDYLELLGGNKVAVAKSGANSTQSPVIPQ